MDGNQNGNNNSDRINNFNSSRPPQDSQENRQPSFLNQQASRVLEEGKRRAQDEIRKQGTKLAVKGARAGAKAGGKAASQAGKLAAKGATQLAEAAASNPYVLLAIAIIIAIILLIILYFYFFGGGASTAKGLNNNSSASQPGTGTGGGADSKIAGFSISLKQIRPPAGGPVSVGDEIEYEISYTYDPAAATVPLESIVLFDTIPKNAEYLRASGAPELDAATGTVTWKLSDPLNNSPLNITLKATVDDTYINNQIFARVGGGGATGGTACTAPYEGTGPCSVAELGKVFTGDPSRAIAASMICQGESTSNPLSKNITSGTGCNNDGENNDDYSIGLFQINLIWHSCKVAPNGYSSTPSSERCQNLTDSTSRGSCETLLEDRNENIQKAFQISSGGVDWSAWSTWPGVNTKLNSCGITVQ